MADTLHKAPDGAAIAPVPGDLSKRAPTDFIERLKLCKARKCLGCGVCGGVYRAI